MSFLKVLQKVEKVILGDKADLKKPKDHWKKYPKQKKEKTLYDSICKD
jgi:hypothetical protein|tara:strand:+ start:200 stop:343 length:144 start_codon:yes stop_codon:yes gene_type:complete